MAVIDDKVVAISFESSKFESGVNKTIASLDKLKSALHFPNAGKGMADLDAAAKKVDMGHIAEGVHGIRRALETLRLVGIGVLSNLAASAVRSGGALVKAFTLDPIKQGLQEYETQINAVQVILGNTAAAGVKLKDVTRALDELNVYADKTIYNFGQMTRNVGTFTAAGVDLKTSVASIKGIANMAALSGSNAEQASTAMYQLSQAISSGKVALMDWRSVENASMGSATFKRALAETAVHMGTLKENAVQMIGPMKNIKIEGESFRNSLSAKAGEESWLTSDVLTTTLKQLSGDMTDAQLAAEGYTEAQIRGIQQMAQTALKAATTVKTFTQLISTTKEQVATGWASTFEIILGDFGEAKTLFTGISNAIGGFVSASANARNKVLQDWKDLGGRTMLIDSIKTAFHNLGMIIKPIKEAFRDIFPAKTGRDLYNLTKQFKDFAEALKPSEETMANLKRTFAGLFAVLSIAKQIIGGVLGVFAQLLGVIFEGSGSFLEITAKIGDFLVSIDTALKKGDRLNKFFDGLGAILEVPLRILGELASAIGDLFSGFSSGGFSGQMGDMTDALNPFHEIMVKLGEIAPKVLETIKEIGHALKPAFDAYMEILQGFGTAIGEAASNMNFDAILAVIKTGLFAGIFLMLKKFLGKGSAITQLLGGLQGISGGILGSIAGSFRALEGSMVAMQQNIKAKTLKEIAIAIALLTASVVALSFVDAEGLKKGITAIGFMMGQLLLAMAIMDKIAVGAGFLKMPIIAASLVVLAGAITVLTVAVFALSRLSWEELLKGLGGVGALLGGLVIATKPLAATGPGLIRASIGITAIAIALNIMALAVRQMGSMDLGQLAKGLGGVAVALGVLVVATNKIPKGGMVGIGVGLMAVAVALFIMSKAVASFGALDVLTLGKGLAAVGASLLIIAYAMKFMPKSMLLTGAGLIAVSVALNLIALAIERMGGMSVEQMAKGLISLAVALGVLAAAMAVMSGMVTGAIALTLVAGGIFMLAGALKTMGSMSWTSIIKSMITMAAALTILGIAGALITPVIPSLLGLGAALLLIGAGLALAGAGIFLIGVGLSAIAVSGATSAGILIAALIQLTEAIPKIAKNITLGLLEIVRALAATAPKFVEAIVKILNSLVDAIILMLPKVEQLFNALITTIISILQMNQDRIIQAGFDLILALLQGIKNNIGPLVALIIDIIANILSTIANNLGKIINAGIQLLGKLIEGILKNISQVATTVVNIITKFLTTIANNLGKITTAGLSILTSLLKAIASHINEVIKVGTDVIVNFVKGIGNAAERIVRAARQAAGSFINTLAEEIVKLADDVFNAMIKLMNGLALVIEERAPEMRKAAIKLGAAIINGLTAGVAGAAQDLYDKITAVMDHAPKSSKEIPIIGSPSKVTTDIGMYIVQGLVKGIDDNKTDLYSSAEEISNGLIDKFNEVFQTASPSKVMMEIGKFVGQGFAEGVRGSSDDIRGAFTDLNNMLTEAMVDARETIVEEEKKLEELRAAKKPDAKAIAEAQRVIAQNEELLRRATAGHITLTKALSDEKAELIRLANDYERVSERLTIAQGKLVEAQKARSDAIKGYSEQYSDLPDIAEGEGTGEEQLANYMEALQNQATAVAAYRETLNKLRKLGLDDETYQKLLEEGTGNQQFADALLAGGKTAIQGLNTLDTQLETEANKLARSAGNNLFDVGVEAAQGVVKGLKSKKSEIYEEMREIAREMVAALKRELKSKSPSQKFAEVGKFAMEGLADGITNSAKAVTDALENAADSALTAMKTSMSNISDMVTKELNPNPVITPILDLTTIRSQAGELGALTQVTPITAAASYGHASFISAEQLAAQNEQIAASSGGTSVKFEQNNYSPEALTEIEIYRQTKNQLSQLKSALALN